MPFKVSVAAVVVLNVAVPVDKRSLKNILNDDALPYGWLNTVLNSVMKNDPELGLRTMSAWHVDNYGTATDGIAKWAAANPRHAAEFALAHPAGYATQNAMEVIGKAWAKTDPGAALSFAAGSKDKFGAALASGTPVRTVADGVVDFAGWKNGYGNVVSVKHGKDRCTVYAHLSRMDVRRGQSVEQGGRIGAVGATGWATGPHLHFEFKVGGIQKDPASIAALADTLAVGIPMCKPPVALAV